MLSHYGIPLNSIVCSPPFCCYAVFLDLRMYSNEYSDSSLIFLRNITTLRFDFLLSFMVRAQPLLFDTWNPEISGFSTAHAYKYKTKRQANMKRRQCQKNNIRP